MLTEVIVFAGVVITAFLKYRGVCRVAQSQENVAFFAAQAQVAVARINAGAQPKELLTAPEPRPKRRISKDGSASKAFERQKRPE